MKVHWTKRVHIIWYFNLLKHVRSLNAFSIPYAFNCDANRNADVCYLLYIRCSLFNVHKHTSCTNTFVKNKIDCFSSQNPSFSILVYQNWSRIEKCKQTQKKRQTRGKIYSVKNVFVVSVVSCFRPHYHHFYYYIFFQHFISFGRYFGSYALQTHFELCHALLYIWQYKCYPWGTNERNDVHKNKPVHNSMNSAKYYIIIILIN